MVHTVKINSICVSLKKDFYFNNVIFEIKIIKIEAFNTRYSFIFILRHDSFFEYLLQQLRSSIFEVANEHRVDSTRKIADQKAYFLQCSLRAYSIFDIKR